MVATGQAERPQDHVFLRDRIGPAESPCVASPEKRTLTTMRRRRTVRPGRLPRSRQVGDGDHKAAERAIACSGARKERAAAVLSPPLSAARGRASRRPRARAPSRSSAGPATASRRRRSTPRPRPPRPRRPPRSGARTCTRRHSVHAAPVVDTTAADPAGPRQKSQVAV